MRVQRRLLGFRTLIIDDDETLLRRLSDTLHGQSVSIYNRKIEPRIDTLKVVVEHDGEQFVFSETTLRDMLNVCQRQYDFIIVDYSYSSKTLQPKQWREGAEASSTFSSNDHLLTLVDLKSALERHDAGHGNHNTKQVANFFNQSSKLLLRSFQHDRKKDKLGPYEQRFENTQGVFPRSAIYRIDSFQMIYNSDAELRKQFYHAPANGREFYRNLVTQFTILHYRAAMYQFLAEKAQKLLIPRSSFALSLLAVAMAATGAFLASLVSPLVAAVQGKDVFAIASYSIVAIVMIMILIVTFGMMMIVERRSISRSDD